MVEMDITEIMNFPKGSVFKNINDDDKSIYIIDKYENHKELLYVPYIDGRYSDKILTAKLTDSLVNKRFNQVTLKHSLKEVCQAIEENKKVINLKSFNIIEKNKVNGDFERRLFSLREINDDWLILE